MSPLTPDSPSQGVVCSNTSPLIISMQAVLVLLNSMPFLTFSFLFNISSHIFLDTHTNGLIDIYCFFFFLKD